MTLTRMAVTLTVAVAAATALPRAALAADTRDYPAVASRGNGVAVPFQGFVGADGRPTPIGGAVGVDLVLGSTARPYLPCQHYNRQSGTGDTFVNACQEKGSYATYTRFPAGSGLVFPHGYFVGNTQPDLVRGGVLNTDWGARTAGLSFEFYPDPRYDAEYVHSRFYVDAFTRPANGWTYSVDFGSIPLLTATDPNTARLGGQLTVAGRPPAPGRVSMTIFGGTAHSSTGQPISSFAVYAGSGSSRWTTSPLYAGSQRITIVDTATRRQCMLDRLNVRGNVTVDFDLAQPGFGHPDSVCTG
ncbi:hypothetical protein [Frankia sp. R82]|uniref:hypothetical protein n=1 Tax=Frankia sp. R82 TaxID=2950553 RepID=UPI002043859D|nr:hypothetical protein [Frankia sp. R82]MCM3887371.1 hypothetical protein [Frankia sp. R82]